MKKLFILLLISSAAMAQNNIQTEKVLIGTIEIDGHTFANSKCDNPIKYYSDLVGIRIYDSEYDYIYRKCSKKECDVIHLEKKYRLVQDWNLNSGSWSISDAINKLK